MQLRTASRMPHLIVLETGDEWIFSVEHSCPGRYMLGDALEIIRLEPALTWFEIRFRIDHQLSEIGFIESFDARGQRGVAQNENRRAVFARDPRRFDRDVKTIFHGRCRENNAPTVTVSAVNRLMQIA